MTRGNPIHLLVFYFVFYTVFDTFYDIQNGKVWRELWETICDFFTPTNTLFNQTFCFVLLPNTLSFVSTQFIENTGISVCVRGKHRAVSFQSIIIIPTIQCLSRRKISFSIEKLYSLSLCSRKLKSIQAHSESLSFIITPILLTFQSTKIAKQEEKFLPWTWTGAEV